MPKPIRGANGNDILRDNGSPTTLSGGNGDDLYVIEDPFSMVMEKKNGGIDTVESTVSFSLANWIEHLRLTGNADTDGAGNNLANQIEGNDGNNILSGMEGDDILTGGMGSDTLLGGEGEDTALFHGSLNDYQIISDDDGLRVLSGNEIDVLEDIEWIQFDDAQVLVSDLIPDTSPPSPANDAATVDEDGAILLNVLANDTGSDLRIISVGEAALGAVTILDDGRIEYLPFENATGDDFFSYTVVDSTGAEASAMVSVSISPVNDDPNAMDDDFVVDVAVGEYTATSSVLDNDTDTDGDALSVQAFQSTTAAGGTVSMDENGFFTYNLAGSLDTSAEPILNDEFTYTVIDSFGATSVATVHLEILDDSGDPPAPDEERAPMERCRITRWMLLSRAISMKLCIAGTPTSRLVLRLQSPTVFWRTSQITMGSRQQRGMDSSRFLTSNAVPFWRP